MPSLSAPDGTTLVYDAYEPSPPPQARAAVIFLPGWADHAGRWAALGERLRDAGLAVYLVDRRGQGRSSGRRAHLSRFSQLLGDLQAVRRAVHRRVPRPQVLFGHSFGGLVALRYLETQPGDPLAATIVASPWLGLAFRPPAWKRVAGRLLADLWPTVPLSFSLDIDHLCRDADVCSTYARDPLAARIMTAGAWHEIQWAQRAVPADRHRIECPLLCLLAGEDRIGDAHLARAFADGLAGPVEVRWYSEMYHEVLHDPQREQVVADVLGFLTQHGIV